jgi:cell division protein FtsI/penicillin-binding protein 2
MTRASKGVELAFHGHLLGQPGSRSVIKDRRGQIVEDVGSIKPPQDGKEIRLALDSKIQYLAYSHLKQAISDTKRRPAASWSSMCGRARSSRSPTGRPITRTIARACPAASCAIAR